MIATQRAVSQALRRSVLFPALQVARQTVALRSLPVAGDEGAFAESWTTTEVSCWSFSMAFSTTEAGAATEEGAPAPATAPEPATQITNS